MLRPAGAADRPALLGLFYTTYPAAVSRRRSEGGGGLRCNQLMLKGGDPDVSRRRRGAAGLCACPTLGGGPTLLSTGDKNAHVSGPVCFATRSRIRSSMPSTEASL